MLLLQMNHVVNFFIFFLFLDFYHFLIVFVCFLCVLCRPIFKFPFVKISNQAWNVNYFENDLVLLYLLKREKDMYIRPLVHSGVYMKPFRDHQTRYL